MKIPTVVLIVVGCLMALTGYLHAGSVQSVPPYQHENSAYIIDVGPGADGTANVVLNVTSSDSTVNVAATCTNASNSNPSFTKTGTVYSATVNYPATQRGKSNPITLIITTFDDGGPCTGGIWNRYFFSAHPSFGCAFEVPVLACLSNFFDTPNFFPQICHLGLASPREEDAMVSSKQTMKIEVHFLKR